MRDFMVAMCKSPTLLPYAQRGSHCLYLPHFLRAHYIVDVCHATSYNTVLALDILRTVSITHISSTRCSTPNFETYPA